MPTVRELMSQNISNAAQINRAFNQIFYFASAYDIFPDGTDVTNKLQELVNLANSEGRYTIVFPPGEYLVTSIVDDGNIVYFGDGASFTGGYGRVINILADSLSINEQLADVALNVKFPPAPLVAAVGDGLTDDTSSIKAIADYAIANGINTLLVPPGSYVVNNLVITGNVSLFCKGATFISNIGTLVFNTWSGKLTGLTIESNSIDVGVNTILLNNSQNAILSDITISPSSYIGVYLYQCKDVILHKVNITNWVAVGLYTETCERVTAEKCNIVGGDSTTSHCVQFNRGKFNKVVDCYLEKGQHFGVSFVQESRSKVVNNTCYNTSAEAINLEGSSNCLVDGNICYWDVGVSSDFGICVFGPDTSKYANLNIVTNNIIARCGKAGIALADLCLFNKVQGNSIYDGNQLMVTDVDGMITLYQQAGTTGPENNTITDNSGSGDKFNYLVKETAGDGNFFGGNYIKNYKPSSKASPNTIIQNPQLTWIPYTPSITSVNGSITTVTVDKAEYAFDGEFIRLNVRFTIPTNGTGAGQIRVPLPVNAVSGSIANSSFTSVETQVLGVSLYVNLTTTEIYLRKYDGSYPGANGAIIQLSGYYNYLG